MPPAVGGERVGGADRVAVAALAVDLGTGVLGDGVVAGQQDGPLGGEAGEDGGDEAAEPGARGTSGRVGRSGGNCRGGRGPGAEGAEQVGDGAAACGEDGGERQQDEAAIGRAGEGRRKRLEDVVDLLGEPTMDAAIRRREERALRARRRR